MIPTANLLVVLFAKIHFVTDAANVAHRDGYSLVFNCDVDNRAADFMFHITNNRAVMCFHSRFRTNQFLITPTAFLFPTKGRCKICQSFCMALRLVAACSASNDGRFVLVPNNGRVNLSEIDTNDIGSRILFSFVAVFCNDMPSVLMGFFVKNKTDFQESQHYPEGIRQGDVYSWATRTHRQFQFSGLEFNARIFPYCCPKLFATPRVFSTNANPSQGVSCLARLEETLLGCVDGVSVHWCAFIYKSYVAKSCERFFGKPQTFLTKQTPMPRYDITVDSSAVLVNAISVFFFKIAREHVSSNHCQIPSCFAFSRINISSIAVWVTPYFLANSSSSRLPSSVNTIVVFFLVSIWLYYHKITIMSILYR